MLWRTTLEQGVWVLSRLRLSCRIRRNRSAVKRFPVKDLHTASHVRFGRAKMRAVEMKLRQPKKKRTVRRPPLDAMWLYNAPSTSSRRRRFYATQNATCGSGRVPIDTLPYYKYSTS